MVAMIWGFPKSRGTILGVPIIRTIVFRGLYWGPLILGNYHLLPDASLSEASLPCRRAGGVNTKVTQRSLDHRSSQTSSMKMTPDSHQNKRI